MNWKDASVSWKSSYPKNKFDRIQGDKVTNTTLAAITGMTDAATPITGMMGAAILITGMMGAAIRITGMMGAAIRITGMMGEETNTHNTWVVRPIQATHPTKVARGGVTFSRRVATTTNITPFTATRNTFKTDLNKMMAIQKTM